MSFDVKDADKERYGMYFEQENRKIYGIQAENVTRLINFMLQVLLVVVVVLYVLSKNGIEVRMGNNTNNVVPVFISIFLNLFLARLIIYSFKICGVSLDCFEKIVIAIAMMAVFIIACFCVATRHHAYFWDETEAYTKLFGIKKLFGNSTAEGIQKLIYLVRTDFKGTLVSCFMIVPFIFTNQTENSWCVSIFFNIIPGVSFVYALFVKSLLIKLDDINKKMFFVINFFIIFSMPLFYTFIFGFSESFSLIFCLIICSIIINISLEKKEYKKWLLIGIAVIMMVMSRDFYLIWGITFFGNYIGFNILNMALHRNFQRLKKWLFHIGSMGICIGSLGIIIMWPFIIKYLEIQESNRDNSFWRIGGFLFEIQTQCGYLGKWLALYILIGFIGGIIHNKSRVLVGFIVGHGVCTVLLFQKMVTLQAVEHSTILLPFYMMSISLTTYILLLYVKKKYIYQLIFYFSIFNMIFSLAGGRYFTQVFTNMSLILRNDQVDQIKLVADWLTEQCQKGEKAYFIPQGRTTYNQDKFRYINMPDERMMDIMPYGGSAVLGYQPFPIALFDAKYILTSTPFCEYGMAERYNDAFYELIGLTHKFSLVKTFDMEDGYTISVYERNIEVDMEEINYYRQYFKEEGKQYPVLYDQVFDQYIQKNGLE